ncbi:MAG: LemA family protein [Oscillospiraceae bacterium]|jgi:LemA protein|nr:LemA family protein [Oscillospiraceae bacterium]
MGTFVAIAIFAVVVIGVVGWAISTSNRFRTLLVKIQESDSGIDVALTKRFDTLTKLADVVRAYAKHESETLSKLVGLRSGAGIAEKSELSRQMDEATVKIRAIAESYPELHSSENYRQLQDAIMDAEDFLQAARRVYNMNVSSFNQAIVQFPASMIANNAHYQPKEFFAAESSKREDVSINLA